MLIRHARRSLAARLVFVALLTSTILSCAGRLTPPAQLSRTGDTAFYGLRVMQGIEALQRVAIDGEAAAVIPTTDARTIVEATKRAGQAGVMLANALKAGAQETTARDTAVATIRSALTDLVEALPKATSDMVGPYVQVVLTMLTVFTTR